MRLTAFLTSLVLLFAVSTVQAEVGHKVGQTAPEFKLKDLDGNTVTLSGLRKKGSVIIVFWSTQCHICHGMIPTFKKLHKEYEKKGVTLVAINVGWESQSSVEAYALKYDLPYMVLNSDSQKEMLASNWKLIGTPTIQVVGKDGRIRYRGHFLPKDLPKVLAMKLPAPEKKDSSDNDGD